MAHIELILGKSGFVDMKEQWCLIKIPMSKEGPQIESYSTIFLVLFLLMWISDRGGCACALCTLQENEVSIEHSTYDEFVKKATHQAKKERIQCALNKIYHNVINRLDAFDTNSIMSSNPPNRFPNSICFHSTFHWNRDYQVNCNCWICGWNIVIGDKQCARWECSFKFINQLVHCLFNSNTARVNTIDVHVLAGAQPVRELFATVCSVWVFSPSWDTENCNHYSFFARMEISWNGKIVENVIKVLNDFGSCWLTCVVCRWHKAV